MIIQHTTMTTKFHQFVTTSLLFSILLNLCPSMVADGDCPYPCLPPPIGGGGTTQVPPTTQTGSYPPPQYYSPPSTGNLPYYPPPSGYAGFGTPPPPDPILPYFPYYYKNGLHPSAATLLHGSIVLMFSASFVVSLCLVLS
ncbi:hypothetical protein Ancab_021163 [Ancistrocladus abbreviatus]